MGLEYAVIGGYEEAASAKTAPDAEGISPGM